MKNVQKPRNPGMTKPDMMHLISDIPEPAAYLAKDRTRRAATKENVAYFFVLFSVSIHACISYSVSGLTERNKETRIAPQITHI